MSKFLIDSNLIIRLVTNDNPLKAKKVLNLINNKSRNLTLLLPDYVITEVIYTLIYDSDLAYSPSDIAKALKPILEHKNLSLGDRQVTLKAIDLFATLKLDFVDCLLIAQNKAKKCDGIYSYDSDLKLPNINCQEP